MPALTSTYASRSQTHPTPLGRRLISLISRKRTNLCVSLDVTSPAELLRLLSLTGPHICLAKTHIDILRFDSSLSIADFVSQLGKLAQEHEFLIFEDRKFADIGNTVAEQYSGGVYRIAEWAHITNAHTVPGPGVIAGLKKVAARWAPEERGLLLLGEMSSKGMLAGGEYLQKTLEMARVEREFVMGFIAMKGVGEEGEDWIVMTPGVQIGSKGDGLGQQYRTPEEVIVGGSDVIIVGRGITGSGDPVEEAKKYREAGWRAYQQRVGGEVNE